MVVFYSRSGLSFLVNRVLADSPSTVLSLFSLLFFFPYLFRGNCAKLTAAKASSSGGRQSAVVGDVSSVLLPATI